MAQEIINLVTAQEQKFNINYNDVRYDFYLSYNDFNSYWIMNITKDEVDIFTGLPMIPGIDVLNGFEYLNLGKFILVDTDPYSTIELSQKEDLGERLKLIREFNG